jgi:hypothetical protein
MIDLGRGEGSGFPHNPGFPTNELFSNVSNCLPYGIGPISWLCEMLKDPRKVSCVNCQSLCIESLFEKGQVIPMLSGFLMIMGYD